MCYCITLILLLQYSKFLCNCNRIIIFLIKCCKRGLMFPRFICFIKTHKSKVYNIKSNQISILFFQLIFLENIDIYVLYLYINIFYQILNITEVLNFLKKYKKASFFFYFIPILLKYSLETTQSLETRITYILFCNFYCNQINIKNIIPKNPFQRFYSIQLFFIPRQIQINRKYLIKKVPISFSPSQFYYYTKQIIIIAEVFCPKINLPLFQSLPLFIHQNKINLLIRIKFVQSVQQNLFPLFLIQYMFLYCLY
eukprot:TRINITY_DN2459_c0_g1_i3.p1 TRINITY_DN2459_c0_g1~~TRINITY_DN2459_c0_g1_i3.p1  ORF type:complete len:254 (+),score=-34.68 TRINITY_DN2459_c0_g1_i3:39-800(+)